MYVCTVIIKLWHVVHNFSFRKIQSTVMEINEELAGTFTQRFITTGRKSLFVAH